MRHPFFFGRAFGLFDDLFGDADGFEEEVPRLAGVSELLKGDGAFAAGGHSRLEVLALGGAFGAGDDVGPAFHSRLDVSFCPRGAGVFKSRSDLACQFGKRIAHIYFARCVAAWRAFGANSFAPRSSSSREESRA